MASKKSSISVPGANGTLYVVATPIGNLGDITQRAIDTLRSVDLILAEDTRSFGTLRTKFDIKARAISYHDHNESSRLDEVYSLLLEGRNIALVSDAGTPLISDPGYRLISYLRSLKINISPIPGPSAVTAAISVCGLETDKFAFIGFLPPKDGKRRSTLETYLALPLTIVCYESPYRIKKVLELLVEIAPNRTISFQRELTKIYEEVINGTASEILKLLEGRQNIKGEIVLLIGKESKKDQKYIDESD
jgi:16S rRNA (cytidine1402-2'-O)-methyltransferase